MCFLRVFSAASATSPTCSPIDLTRLAADVILSRSILLRSIFFTDFGTDGGRSLLSGLRCWLRLFRATPPATPATAAPTAISGAFAFEATLDTFSPAWAIGPFADEERPLEERLLPAEVVVRLDVLAPPPFELDRRVRDDLLDLEVPFLLVDLLAPDPPRLERVLEDLVV